jgi:coatomer subunit beta
MLICTSIIRVGTSEFCKSKIDEDAVDRIMACIRSLSEFQNKKELEKTFLVDTQEAFKAMIKVEDAKRQEKLSAERAKTAIQVDDVVSIRQLAKRNAVDGADDAGMDLEKATGGDAATEDLSSKLSRVVQLTGFSDVVYAEAYVKVSRFVYRTMKDANMQFRLHNSTSSSTSCWSTCPTRLSKTSASNSRR